MRSADRRKAFFAVCMMAVLLFSHLGVCLWQTQIAQVQNLTAEVGGEAQGADARRRDGKHYRLCIGNLCYFE